MRRHPIVALVLFALAAVPVALVACSDSSSCKQGTLSMQVLLSGSSIFADTLTVTSNDAVAMLSQSFPHTPGDANAANLDITFPNGYPTDMVVHLIIRAIGGTTILGANAATIHLDPKCTSGHVSIFGVVTQDAAASD